MNPIIGLVLTLVALTCVPAAVGMVWVAWPSLVHKGRHRR